MFKFIYRLLYILSLQFIFPDWFYVVRYIGNIFLRETIERWSTRYPKENILRDEVLYHNMDLKMNQLLMQVLYIHILYKTCNKCIKKRCRMRFIFISLRVIITNYIKIINSN